MFIARYGLSPCITQIRFVIKRLTEKKRLIPCKIIPQGRKLDVWMYSFKFRKSTDLIYYIQSRHLFTKVLILLAINLLAPELFF